MFHTHNLLYLVLLPWITIAVQINLYHTEWTHTNENDPALQHDCLRVSIFYDVNEQLILDFCMSEPSSKFNVRRNDSFQQFTFVDLSKMNITSQQLYFWSAPIDTVEDYQLYLDQMSTSNDSSLSMKVFYNCTAPRFGPFCQYQLRHHSPLYPSAYHPIGEFYQSTPYQPTKFTCYQHLRCDRGADSSCLDWSEICDGKIDCFNGGLDEQYCWQLEINECQENEHRCRNGQCIPQAFMNDQQIGYDCLDGSDEYHPLACSTKSSLFKHLRPTFACEDVTCTLNPFTSSCVEKREDLLMIARYSNRDAFKSEICQSVLLCMINFPSIDYSHCKVFCEKNACSQIIVNNCSDVLYFSTVPIFFGDIYVAHTKYDLQLTIQNSSEFYSICYNASYYDDYFINMSKTLINNMTCIYSSQILLQPINPPFAANVMYRKTMEEISLRLRKYHHSYNYTSEMCHRRNIYQCLNSSKCISIHRLFDAIYDCPYMDDEDIRAISSHDHLEFINNNYFYCPTANKYVRQSLVNNRFCDCYVPGITWCEDEHFHVVNIQKNVVFQYVCDGFIDMLPKLINGRNETDETECEQWECNNIYTRCDEVWNCLNGADELDCGQWFEREIDCPSQHHRCISPRTNTLTCLPIEKANDGYIDCLGATDEFERCGNQIQTISRDKYHVFHCNHQGSSLCITKNNLCDGEKQCENGDDEQFCRANRTMVQDESFCQSVPFNEIRPVERFLCTFTAHLRRLFISFRPPAITATNLGYLTNVQNQNLFISSDFQTSNSVQYRCHRGLDVYVWLNNTRQHTTTTCLCPPSFYGDQCQYQNQRISLTVRFRAFSDSWQTLFTIIISLIDDSDDGIIHSYEQTSYISIKCCQTKFHFYLLYSIRPKDPSKNYSIQIDFYEKILPIYRGSLLFPVQFSFLPVHRLAYLIDIPPIGQTIPKCINDLCHHGQCFGYLNQAANRSFCRCNDGWSGRYCTVPYNHSCSSDSLYLGRSANNRSICLCPVNRFGPRCLLSYEIFQETNQSICKNNGTFILLDPDLEGNKKYYCMCPKGFTGDLCDIPTKQFLFSFDRNIGLSQSILIHFLKLVYKHISFATQYNQIVSVLERGSTFRTIPLKQDSINIFWPERFDLGFVEFRHEKRDYYLFNFDANDSQPNVSIKQISAANRCPSVNELFNQTLRQWDLIRRVKYYHLPCQRNELNLSCFYDEEQFCLCYPFGQKRLANCFRFDHNMKFDCRGQNDCENRAQCFEENVQCPKQMMCFCEPCFFGRKCQFSTSGFGLSLDGIIGYHIQQHVPLANQSTIVQVSFAFTVIILVAGLIDGILCLMTFKNKAVREVGCGLYLFGLAITTLLTIITFGLKFFILLFAQMSSISDRSFLTVQCLSLDWILRVCLYMNQWLNACVAIERTIISIKGVTFDKKQSKRAVKFVVIGLFLVIVGSCIHDPFHRHLIDEENEDGENKRIWCIVKYSSGFKIYDYIIQILHFFGPFLVNLMSSILLLVTKTRQYMITHSERSYQKCFRKQFYEHKHLLIGPIVLVLLALPRLVIAFISKCMKTADDVWLFLIGYYISFIPTILTFVIFVLPSRFYRKEFQNSLLQSRFCHLCRN